MKRWRASSARMALSNSWERTSDALRVVTVLTRQPLWERSWATRRARALVQRAEGFLGVRWSSVHMNPEATSMAVYCQQVPYGARQAADREAVQLHDLAGMV